jgi:hypothetical protein
MEEEDDLASSRDGTFLRSRHLLHYAVERSDARTVENEAEYVRSNTVIGQLSA